MEVNVNWKQQEKMTPWVMGSITYGATSGSVDLAHYMRLRHSWPHYQYPIRAPTQGYEWYMKNTKIYSFQKEIPQNYGSDNH